ncbi:hypothetical protein TPAR_08273, partial [Tolypocladium paradoxum]
LSCFVRSQDPRCHNRPSPRPPRQLDCFVVSSVPSTRHRHRQCRPSRPVPSRSTSVAMSIPPSGHRRPVVPLRRSHTRTFSVGSTELAGPSSPSPSKPPLLLARARQTVQDSPLNKARATQAASAPLKS